MKKIIFTFIFVFLLSSSVEAQFGGSARETAKLGKYFTGNTAVKATPGAIYGVVGRRTTPGTAWSVIVSDDTDTGNTASFKINVSDLTDSWVVIPLDWGARCDTGIYVDSDNFSGTIYYK